ncbi:MAG: hypothetical protein ACJAVM_003089 [Sulfitobacter sp.]|jgi:hypothetical protein
MKQLCLYLEPALRQSAETGGHNFINLITELAENALFRIEYCDFPAQPGTSDTYSLTHMSAPPVPRGLVFRRACFYPFWQIDASAERWNWDVAKADFDATVTRPDAQRFYRYWQNRLFGAAAQETTRSGAIYVPLQGQLCTHRSFQICSPLDMLEQCLAHDPKRRVIAGLHPNEDYSQAEMIALESLAQKHARLTIVRGGMQNHLQHCDFVVTQNSAVAFAGYFFGKAALLFGKIDFHHIAEKADLANLERCFHAVSTIKPDFASYLHWYWQEQSINAGRPDAKVKIAARLRRFGWPID